MSDKIEQQHELLEDVQPIASAEDIQPAALDEKPDYFITYAVDSWFVYDSDYNTVGATRGNKSGTDQEIAEKYMKPIGSFSRIAKREDGVILVWKK